MVAYIVRFRAFQRVHRGFHAFYAACLCNVGLVILVALVFYVHSIGLMPEPWGQVVAFILVSAGFVLITAWCLGLLLASKGRRAMRQL